MDVEDVGRRCSIILFVVGFSLLILIYIPQTYSWLHLGFYHFVASIIMLALSGMFVLIYLYFFLTWGPTEYEMPTFPTRETIRTKPVVKNKINPRRQRRKKLDSNVDPPTREELRRLKAALGIEKGSLQYKKRGCGVYRVIYQSGRYVWTYIDSWTQLKQKLQG